MQLPRDGVEYATVTFTAYPTGATVEASLDRTTWFPFDIPPTAVGATYVGKVLLRGPDTTSTDGHLVTVDTVLWTRVTDTPEILPVRAGVITLI